jgi:hypothetical protein
VIGFVHCCTSEKVPDSPTQPLVAVYVPESAFVDVSKAPVDENVQLPPVTLVVPEIAYVGLTVQVTACESIAPVAEETKTTVPVNVEPDSESVVVAVALPRTLSAAVPAY